MKFLRRKSPFQKSRDESVKHIINCNTCSLVDNTACWNGKQSTEYRGRVSVTAKGQVCQAWSAQKPHAHDKYNDDASFPLDGAVSSAMNYCRDPNGIGRTWCYTTDPDVRWDYCEPPICSGRLFFTLVLLNKLRCHAYFSFSANQITWSALLL